MLHSDGSDSDSGRENETEAKNKDEDVDMIQEGNVNDQPSGTEHHNGRT